MARATLFGELDSHGQMLRFTCRLESIFDYATAAKAYGCRTTQPSVVLRFPPELLTIHDLRELFDNDIEIDEGIVTWGEVWQNRMRRSVSIQALPDVTLDDPLNDVLRPYQRVGAKWIASAGNCMLGDDPGIGKTLQALVADRMMGSQHTVILSPVYVTPVWSRHLTQFMKVPHVVAYHEEKAKREKLLESETTHLITNHETLRGNYPQIFRRRIDHLIVDEAHRFQGRNSKQTRGLRILARRARKVTLLSGSLVWNQPDSLWSLLNVLYPKRFGSYWTFVEHFCNVEMTPWGQKIVGVDEETLDRLHWVLAPILLRRRKHQVVPDLPEKQVLTLEYELTASQRRAYKSSKEQLRMETNSGRKLYHLSGGDALMAMRRTLNMPERLDLGTSNPKSKLILELVQDTAPPIVIFVWHTEYADYLNQKIPQAACITGRTPVRTREELVQKFLSGKLPVLIANIAAAGLGIDLHSASVAIFAEGTLPGHLNSQAEDRLHRIGQKQVTTIYRLMAPGTIESHLWKLSEQYHAQSELTLATKHLVDSILQET